MRLKHTVYPRNGDGLKENRKQHGVTGCVSVEKVEKIEAPLRAGGQSHKEIKREEARHEDFSVPPDFREFITQSRYDRL